LVYFLQKAKSQEVEEQENQGQFGIATELKKAEKFDDVVFAYEPKNEEGEADPHFLFIQAKHKQDGKIPIKYKDLFSKSAKEPFQVTNVLKDTPSRLKGAANAGPVGHSWPARAF
jgi:U3 small nucleolar ribonucleoprotein component